MVKELKSRKADIRMMDSCFVQDFIVSDDSIRRISFLIESTNEQLICTEDLGYQ